MPVSKRTRYEVLKRDNHTCRYCHAADSPLTVDHVTPVALGGTDFPDNLVAACQDCNYGKASTSPDAAVVADVEQRSLRWAAAMKVAAQRLSTRDEPMRQYVAYMEDVVRSLFGGYDDLPNDWRESLVQFYRAGLPLEMTEQAVALSVAKGNVEWPSKWRYACGVAWTMIRELQDEARLIVESED